MLRDTQHLSERDVRGQRTAPMAADAPQTLREWLREGSFSLTLSQGFCCFPALAGALLAIEEALDVPLRRKVHAVSGSSGGAIVAALSSSARN